MKAHPGDMQKLAEGREAEIFAFGDGTVLRLLRGDGGTARLEREAAAMRAAASRGVPVPAPGDVVTVDGRAGMVMERVDGPDLLSLLGRRPWALPRAARVTGELHADLHATRAPGSLPSLRETCERRIRGLDVPPEFERLRSFALDTLASLPDGDALCHGDFHPGNIIDTARGPVVIDWPNVTRGDADGDYARTLLMLRLGEPPPGSPVLIRALAHNLGRLFLNRYRAAYERRRRPDRAMMPGWEIVRAADRLADGIASERAKLVAMLDARHRAWASRRA